MSGFSDVIRVLHVDDEPELSAVAAEFLEREDERLAVETVAETNAALDRLTDGEFDCVVSDYDMPDRTGIEFLEALRETHPDLPFILFTDQGSEAIASNAISAGVTDYLQKETGPEQYKLLANRIVNGVESARAKKVAKRSQVRLETLSAAFPDVAFYIDETGRYRDVLAGSESPLLYDEAEALIGERLHDGLPTETADRFLETVTRSLETDSLQTLEYELEVQSGWKWFEARVAPLSATDTEADMVVWVARDITERKHREQSLREERDRLSTLFDNFPNPVVYGEMTGETPTVKDVNPAFEETFGYDRDAVVGENPDDLIVPPDDHETAAEINRAVASQANNTYEIWRETVDGRRFFQFDSGFRETDDGQTVEGYAIYTDVTDHKERERELQQTTRRLESIIENASAAIFIKDVEGTYLLANEATAEFFDLDPEAVVGKTDADLFGEDGAAEIRADDDRVIENGESITIETTRLIDGEKHAFLTNKYPYYDEEGAVIGVVGITRDVTEREQYVRQLERERARLEEFASVLSHDLRNPLQVAETRLALAREAHDSLHLDELSHTLDRMEALIDDVLTLAREGQRVREPDPVDLAEVGADARRTVDAESARIDVEAETTVNADASRLQELLENLLRNAVEHGGSDVTVTIGDCTDGFYVADNGPGIPAVDREEVFDRGYSTAEGGTGFGLSIVAEIADAHGWDVTVTDSEAGGARFEITGVEVG
jgi:PAS domain S-box-containing protein